MRLIFFPIGLLIALVVLGVMVPLGVALVFAAHFAMPWLVLGFVIWAFYTVFGGGRRRQRRWERDWYAQPMGPRHPPYGGRPPYATQPSRPTPPPPPPAPAPRPQPTVAPAKPELPLDVQVRVEQIRRKVDMLLGYASRFEPFSHDLYMVRQTAEEYLPRTINAYLAMPPGSGETTLVSSGKTALQELKEQLDLLDSKLNDIAEDLQRQDVDRLLSNRHFLEDRFGDKHLNGSAPAATAPTES